MRYINAFISALFVLLLSCSFPTTSGTGHEGEARVIGIAHTSTGVYKNGELFIADKAYLPAISRSVSITGKSVKTDNEGRFEVYVPKDIPHVLSGKIDNEILYHEIAATSTPVELGAVHYEKGANVTVHPAGTDTTYTHLLVPGTDWIFELSSKLATNIVLPQENISIVRKGSYFNNNENVSFADTSDIDIETDTIIGEEIPNDSLISYSFPDSVELETPCRLEVLNKIDGDRYSVDWGDTSNIDIDTSGFFQHIYSSRGMKFVKLSRVRFDVVDTVDDTIMVY